MSDLSITEFLLARIAEEESMWRLARDAGAALVVQNGVTPDAYLAPTFADRRLAECEAKRRIVEWHKNWPVLVETPPTFERVGSGTLSDLTYRATQQIMWTTEQQYRERFGTEPPTSPVLRMMAALDADHPDYRDEWRP